MRRIKDSRLCYSARTKKTTTMLNPYRFGGETPIMSFQTSYSGTFTPIITPSSGTLIWEVDGIKQTTNAPSYTLTGATVDVKVYANDVLENGEITVVDLSGFNLSGALSFEWFTLNGSFYLYDNTNITGFTLSANSNVINDTRIYNTGISSFDFTNATLLGVLRFDQNSSLTSTTFKSSGNSTSSLLFFSNPSLTSLDLSSFTITGQILGYSCTSLSSLTFAPSGNSCSGLRLYSCAFTSLDFSSFTFTGVHYLYSNPSLSSVTYSASGNNSNDYRAYSCSFATHDLSSFSLSGILRLDNNSLVSVVWSASNSSSNFQVHNNDFTSLDLSSFTFTGSVYFYNNPLTSVIFKSLAQTILRLRAYNCSLTVIDLSDFTVTSEIDLGQNDLTSITQSSGFGAGFDIYDVEDNVLDTTEIDKIFSALNTYFTSNIPTNDLAVRAGGTGNGSPTGGSSNVDIVNLESIYTTAGFAFNYSIN